MEDQILSIIAVSVSIISFLGGIISAINHKRIRSNCCGKEISSSIDIENTTPVLPN